MPEINIVDIYNYLLQNVILILGGIGILVFCVQVFVQMTKELPGIRKIPTKLFAIIVSIIICNLALFIYAALVPMMVYWYYIVLATFAAFVVAYVAINGWDTLKELWTRCMVSESVVPGTVTPSSEE